jgi:arylsulfatase A-like enzyme
VNIVLYVIDCLRADHVSCYGYSRQTTPHIDVLANEGIVFERAFSPSTWTKPVAASILTGVYPPTHGVRMRSDVMSHAFSTLPEWLGRLGYATLAISTIGNFSSSLGFDKGFDLFLDLYKEPALRTKRTAANIKREKLYLEKQGNVIFPIAEDINEAVFPWIKEHHDQNFFTLLWAMDPHDPYDPPGDWKLFVDPSYKGRMDGSRELAKGASKPKDLQHLIDRYDSEIAYTDHCFGQLINYLKHLEIYDRTAIFVLGDHGESFGDHGQMLHGHLPFEEIIRVPLILRLPSGSHTGIRIQGLVSLLDIMPTALELADIPRSQWESLIQGNSLFDSLKNSAPSSHKMIFSELKTTEAHNDIISLRTENWKYIWIKSADNKNRLNALCRLVSDKEMLRELCANPFFYIKRQMHRRREYLFDISNDRGETQNLASKMPQQVGWCRDRIGEWQNRCREMAKECDGSDVQSKIDQATLDQLRALGYL